jgi:hypothetical protein
MTQRKTTEEADAKAEIIYWATGRTKIYPEKDFAKNYAEIKEKSKQKRERQGVFARFGTNLKN